MRVLIVDDNALFRSFLGDVVRSFGGCPMFASDGAEALEMIGVIAPHLIFTDIVMPTLDGFGLLAAVRAAHGATIPMVAVTAHWRTAAQAEFIAAGFDWAIEKPLQATQVLEVMQALGAVAGPAASGEARGSEVGARAL